MKVKRTVNTVDAHTAGEPTRIVTAGIPHVPGRDMKEKKKWILHHLDGLRRMLMWEPRGHQDMFGAVLTAPAWEEAHAGVVFMDSGGYLDMCGHGSMGVATVLVETGMVPVDDTADGEEKIIRLDTPAGRVEARVRIADGEVEAVTIRNVPAFYYDTVTVPVASVGQVQVDIAYGGNFFALVDASRLKVPLALAHLDRLKALGLEIRDRVNQTCDLVHPGTGHSSQVDLTEIYQHGDPVKNMVVFGNGQVDRSPLRYRHLCQDGVPAPCRKTQKRRVLSPCRYVEYGVYRSCCGRDPGGRPQGHCTGDHRQRLYYRISSVRGFR